MYRKPFVRLVLLSTLLLGLAIFILDLLLLGLAIFILDLLLLGLAIFKLVDWRANALPWVLVLGMATLLVGLAPAWFATWRGRSQATLLACDMTVGLRRAFGAASYVAHDFLQHKYPRWWPVRSIQPV